MSEGTGLEFQREMAFWYTTRSVTYGTDNNSRTVSTTAPGRLSWTVHSGGACRFGHSFDEAVDALAKSDSDDVGDPEGAEWMRANRAEIMRRLGLTPEGL